MVSHLGKFKMNHLEINAANSITSCIEDIEGSKVRAYIFNVFVVFSGLR